MLTSPLRVFPPNTVVFADEAQDFSDLDMALFIRMSSSVRNLFLGADPAQSVELGIRMRVGTVNGVFHSCLPKNQKNIQVSLLASMCSKRNWFSGAHVH